VGNEKQSNWDEFTKWWNDWHNPSDAPGDPREFAYAVWLNARSKRTPDTTLPPLVPDDPRRKMLISIEVSANFEKRLDNQWEVEREINADRWSWQWAPEPTPDAVAEHIAAMVEGLSHSSIGQEILRTAQAVPPTHLKGGQ
jgi:hypothetical protein